jgi:DNA-binding MarR family transcriptional regulator
VSASSAASACPSGWRWRCCDGAIEIAHPITRQELADLSGTTLFTVSRLLSRWQERGLIASTRGRVTVQRPRDIAALAAAGDETSD